MNDKTALDFAIEQFKKKMNYVKNQDKIGNASTIKIERLSGNRIVIRQRITKK